jgi:hypothetical protein
MLIFFAFSGLFPFQARFGPCCYPTAAQAGEQPRGAACRFLFPPQCRMRAAEKLPEINLHKKMAASGMEHALRTFCVQAARFPLSPCHSGMIA